MANFELFKIQDITEKDLDTDIKSKATNGVVKTRARFTKVRKQFTIKAAAALTLSEVTELRQLYKTNRTITSWDFTHPTEGTVYRVRFKAPIEVTQLGAKANYFSVADIILEEV